METARAYELGDPTQFIDWKVFARTDQLIIREQLQQSAARVTIQVDLSPTMLFPIDLQIEDLPPTKQEIALRIALNLAHIHLQSSDLVQLQFNDKSIHQIQLKSLDAVAVLYQSLSNSSFRQPTDSIAKNANKNSIANTDILYYISDCLDAKRIPKHTLKKPLLCVFQVLSSLELSSHWLEKTVHYQTVDRTEKKLPGSLLLKKKYYENTVSKFIDNLKKGFQSRGAAFFPAHDQVTISQYLHFLQNIGAWKRNE